jgi:hypothetical protein
MASYPKCGRSSLGSGHLRSRSRQHLPSQGRLSYPCAPLTKRGDLPSLATRLLNPNGARYSIASDRLSGIGRPDDKEPPPQRLRVSLALSSDERHAVARCARAFAMTVIAQCGRAREATGTRPMLARRPVSWTLQFISGTVRLPRRARNSRANKEIFARCGVAGATADGLASGQASATMTGGEADRRRMGPIP